MIKIIVSVSLLLVLAVGLFACGSTSTTTTKQTSTTTTQTSMTTTTTSKPTTTTTQDTVTKSKSAEIKAFGFPQQTEEALINAFSKTVNITVKYDAPITALIATYELSPGASATVNNADQVSGTTKNDFTNPVKYVVTAEDSAIVKEWTVTVSLAEAPPPTTTVYVPPVIEGTVACDYLTALTYVGTDTMVAVTGEVTGTFTEYGMNVFFLGPDENLGVNCSSADILEMPIDDYIGRTVTVVGKVGTNAFTGAPEIAVSDAVNIILAPEGAVLP